MANQITYAEAFMAAAVGALPPAGRCGPLLAWMNPPTWVDDLATWYRGVEEVCGITGDEIPMAAHRHCPDPANVSK